MTFIAVSGMSIPTAGDGPTAATGLYAGISSGIVRRVESCFFGKLRKAATNMPKAARPINIPNDRTMGLLDLTIE